MRKEKEENIRVFAILIGLGTIAYTFVIAWQVLLGHRDAWSLHNVWLLATFWLHASALALYKGIQTPEIFANYSFQSWLALGLYLAAATAAPILAGYRDRSRLGWFTLCLIFPYALIALAVLQEAHLDGDGLGDDLKAMLKGSRASGFRAPVECVHNWKTIRHSAGANTIYYIQRCSNCGAEQTGSTQDDEYYRNS